MKPSKGLVVRSGLLALCLCLCLGWLKAQAPDSDSTGWTLAVDSGSNAVGIGHAFGLVVTSTDTSAGQHVTFFDGVTILGTASFTDQGQATLHTFLSATGAHQIRAQAWGAGVTGSAKLSVTVVEGKTIPSERTLAVPAGHSPRSIAVADFNNDGKIDVVVTNVGSGTASVLLGNPDGSFGAPIPASIGNAPTALAIADFDGDGFTDLAVADASGMINVRLGAGDGTFHSQHDYLAGVSPSAIAVADFNGDGIPDLAVTNQASGTLNIFLGIGDGTFQILTEIPAGSQPAAITTSDFNNDGITDLAVANYDTGTITVLLGSGDGTFTAAPTVGSPDSPVWLAAKNFTTARPAGLLIASATSGSITQMQGNGDGTFQPGTPTDATYNAQSSAVADFDQDGRIDTAVVDPAGLVKINFGQAAAAGPDVTISNSHTGNFYQGQTDAQYSLTVTNVGTATTTGTITVVDTLPAGLTATAIAGGNWTCTLATLTCNYPFPVSAGAGTSPVIVTVTVANNASTPLVNSATISGGGDVNGGNNSATDSTVITGPSDLTIVEAHTGNFYQGQTDAAFSITVTNSGPAPTNATISVVASVPAGLTPTSISGGNWTCTLATLTCTYPFVVSPASGTAPISVVMTVANNATTPLVGSATVSGGGEQNTANDTATNSVTITGPSDLTIVETHTGNFYQGQTDAAFSITVTNSGPAPTNATFAVVVTLPAGLTATNIAGNNWTCTLATLTCTIPFALGAGSQTAPISVVMTVANNATTPLVGSATVSGGGEQNTANDTATDSVTITGPSDLTIVETHTGSFYQGQTDAAFSITVTNAGPAPTNATFTVVVTLPAGLIATSIAGNNWTCTLATLSCSIPFALGAGSQTAPISVTMTVANNATSPLVGSATVSGGGEQNTANDTATNSVTITGPSDLTIVETHTGNFFQGQTDAAFSITVTNSGPAPTNATITVVATLPAGLTATSIAGNNWTCTLATVTCTIPFALGAGSQTAPISVVMTVANNATTPLVGSATVSGGGEQNTANDTATSSVTITGPSDLTIVETHSGNFFQGQTNAVFAITVTNSGLAQTNGTITMVAALPSGLTATSIAGNNWTCTLATLTCTFPFTLNAATAAGAINVTVTVANNAASPLVASATVSGGGEQNTANDTASDSVTITGPADLTVTKSHSGNFTAGQTGATYTIGVNNIGLAPTNTTITLVDTLPSGLTATAISGNNWNCTLATVSCTYAPVVAAGASTPSITVTVNVANNATSPQVNTATVSGGGEANTANDTATDSTTITAATLQSIAVTPANPSVTKGTTQQFTATGTFSDASTQNLTGSVTWGSATPATATINASGLATALNVGTTSISATLGAVSGSTVLTVTAATLQSIAVTPANPSVTKGTTQQFTATGTFSDASTQNLTGSVTWGSATPATATINASGLATAVNVGTTSISATLGAVSGSTVLTVTAATLQSIAVTPANPSVTKGTTQQFTATGTFSDASTQNVTGSVTWGSATPATATITAGGLASAVNVGTSSISATLGAVSGSTVLTVTAATLQSIAVTPANPSVTKGTTQQFTATGTFSDASTQNVTGSVTWGSATPATATINASGLATAVNVGTTSISATLGAVSGSTVLTVTAATPTQMTANAGTTPQSATINTAFANALAVTVKDVGNNPLSGVNVTFTAPNSGASGLFSNSTTTITVPTTASGVASAPFTANATAGGPYAVTATATGLTPVNFSLTNSAVVAPPTVVAFRVLFGSTSFNVTGSSRNRLPWQITGIQVVFSSPITAGSANSLGGLTPTGFSGLGTTTLTWTINPISLGQFMATLSGSGPNALMAGGLALGGGTGAAQLLRVLNGDYNDDGVVNASDQTLVLVARNAPYDIFADLNGDGIVNTADVQVVRTQIGNTLP